METIYISDYCDKYISGGVPDKELLMQVKTIKNFTIKNTPISVLKQAELIKKQSKENKEMIEFLLKGLSDKNKTMIEFLFNNHSQNQQVFENCKL